MGKENAEFGRRLRAALKARGMEPSAASLEKRFNSRYAGAPVTAQAISGWLTGKHIPRQDRLRVLAGIVGMEPYALQYGPGNPGTSAGRIAEDQPPWLTGLRAKDREVIEAFLALPPRSRELVGELVASLGERRD